MPTPTITIPITGITTTATSTDTLWIDGSSVEKPGTLGANSTTLYSCTLAYGAVKSQHDPGIPQGAEPALGKSATDVTWWWSWFSTAQTVDNVPVSKDTLDFGDVTLHKKTNPKFTANVVFDTSGATLTTTDETFPGGSAPETDAAAVFPVKPQGIGSSLTWNVSGYNTNNLIIFDTMQGLGLNASFALILKIGDYYFESGDPTIWNPEDPT